MFLVAVSTMKESFQSASCCRVDQLGGLLECLLLPCRPIGRAFRVFFVAVSTIKVSFYSLLLPCGLIRRAFRVPLVAVATN